MAGVYKGNNCEPHIEALTGLHGPVQLIAVLVFYACPAVPSGISGRRHGSDIHGLMH